MASLFEHPQVNRKRFLHISTRRDLSNFYLLKISALWLKLGICECDLEVVHSWLIESH